MATGWFATKHFPGSNLLRATSVFAETDATLIEINLDVLAKAAVEWHFQVRRRLPGYPAEAPGCGEYAYFEFVER